MSQPVVSLQNIHKVFGEGKSHHTPALQDIQLTIAQGEFLSIIGPSGCGKSTLLRLIADLITPSTGELQVNGKTAHQARLDQDYGIVFQAPVLFEWRTILENVQLPLELRGLDKVEQQKRAKEMLALVELSGFEKHYPWQLSGGMQQRAAIARALAVKPALLLMDEPFGALDEMTRERMQMELHQIWGRTGITVLFITHSIPEAVFLSTQIAVMSARPGRVTELIPVSLPPQRDVETREQADFFKLVNRVRESLRRVEGSALSG